MILCYGPRRLRVGPIYSQLTRSGGGKGANNVHKFERWLRHAHAAASVATTYAPICFGGGGLGGGGVPCTLLRENINDNQGTRAFYQLRCFRAVGVEMNHSAVFGGNGSFHERGHDSHRRKKDTPHWPPIQGTQEDGDSAIHVLQSR